jgi:hypothetical protein
MSEELKELEAEVTTEEVVSEEAVLEEEVVEEAEVNSEDDTLDEGKKGYDKKKMSEEEDEEDDDEDEEEDDEDEEDVKESFKSEAALLNSMINQLKEMDKAELQAASEKLLGEAEEVVEEAVEEVAFDATEEVNTLFGGEDLSEEFKSNAKAVFEAAVTTKVKEQVALSEEALQEKVEIEKEEFAEGLIGKVDEYLDYVVENYLEENRIAVESGLKVEIVEDFLSGLKNLFVENYIEIPEEKADLVDEFANRIEELEESLEKEVSSKKELTEKLNDFSKAKVISEETDSLSAVQADKVMALAEEIEFVSEDDFRGKVNLIKEKYFADETVGQAQPLHDDVEGLQEEVQVPQHMRMYVDGISKTIRK